MTNETKTVQAPGPTPEQIAEDPIMKFFGFGHLPVQLQQVSSQFFNLAAIIQGTLPKNAERTVALRKLLECKDAAVRASIV